METVDRFLTSEKQSFFLLGPRVTGKSTFINKAFPDALYLDLLLPDVYWRTSAGSENRFHCLWGKNLLGDRGEELDYDPSIEPSVSEIVRTGLS
jgi:hypothetical protein